MQGRACRQRMITARLRLTHRLARRNSTLLKLDDPGSKKEPTDCHRNLLVNSGRLAALVVL